MRRIIHIAAGIMAGVAAVVAATACSGGKATKDRSGAVRMFFETASLIENHTGRVAEAPDSATWANVCLQFEDSLEKINFSYPADTDLLLSEGQNDTIARLLKAYIEARDERILTILHPSLPLDSLAVDSTATINNMHSD